MAFLAHGWWEKSPIDDGSKKISKFFWNINYFAITAVWGDLMTAGFGCGYPGGDGILHVGDSFLLGFALRDAAGKAGNLGDPAAVFVVGLENDLPHGLILASYGSGKNKFRRG
jgi:hypothetical protein